MTLKLNLLSIWQNLIEPECSSQKTEIGTQVLNKLLLGTSAGSSSRSSSPWNFSCHLLLMECTSFNHCKELQLCLGVLFFLVILTGKILKKGGHCTTGTQTIPVLPEGWGQAKLQNGSQMFRWHLARKKPVQGPGQPGPHCSPQFTKCMSQESSFHLCLPQIPHGQGWELGGCTRTPWLPGFGTAGPQGSPEAHQHTPIPQG